MQNSRTTQPIVKQIKYILGRKEDMEALCRSFEECSRTVHTAVA